MLGTLRMGANYFDTSTAISEGRDFCYKTDWGQNRFPNKAACSGKNGIQSIVSMKYRIKTR